MSLIVHAAVEGVLDEQVAIKIIRYAGAAPGRIYGKGGKAALRSGISGYNNAAKYYPWLVIVDLKRDAQCAPLLCREWLPNPAPWI